MQALLAVLMFVIYAATLHRIGLASTVRTIEYSPKRSVAHEEKSTDFFFIIHLILLFGWLLVVVVVIVCFWLL